MLALSLLVACRPEAPSTRPQGPAPTQPEPIVAQLEDATRAWHDAGQFEGVVLVGRGDRIVYQGAFGLADREHDRPNTVDTRFPIASLTKQLTAVLVMQQVERGRIELDTPIASVLPWFRPETADPIRIRDLLMHASGLPDVPTEVYFDPEPRVTDSRWLLEHHITGPLQFEPGTAFAYTNADYHVLTAVLEALEGKDYTTILREQITEPLGMTATALADRDADLSDYARDYVQDGEDWIPAPPYRWQNWQGAGGVVSTLADLHRWNRALASHALVREDTWRTMLTPRTDLPGGNYVGIGSWVYPRPLPGTDETLTLVERRGAIGGYTILDVLVEGQDAWIVLLANHYNEQIHTLPYADCLPLDLLLVLRGHAPRGPSQP